MHLKHAYGTAPSDPATVHHLRTRDARSFLVYPDADAIVILSAHSLKLVRILAFSEAYSSASHTTEAITCTAVDPSMALVFAAMNTRIAAWSLSGLQHDTWRVHSILHLHETQTITTLDCISGLLAVGTRLGLSVYTLVLENDLPTWSQKWVIPTVSPALVRFSPSLMYLVITSRIDYTIRLYSTASGRQVQVIPHPSSIVNLSWRESQRSSRDDLILYTVTHDAVIRIFLPVLDSPQHLQLHASLDSHSPIPSNVTSNSGLSSSSAFWLDRQVMGVALNAILTQFPDSDSAENKRIRELKEEGGDIFLRILRDGSVSVNVITNIDRKPPTLLKQYTLQLLPPSTFPEMPSCLFAIPGPNPGSISLITASPLSVFNLVPTEILGAGSGKLDSLQPYARLPHSISAEKEEVAWLVRTPEGEHLGVKRISENGEIWKVMDYGCSLAQSGKWKSADLVVVLQEGQNFVTYSSASGLLTLHSTPPQSLPIPKITTLFSMPSSQGGCESLIGVTDDFSMVHLHTTYVPSPRLTYLSQTGLPIPTPKAILPVDPMGWSASFSWVKHDVLLSISATGELAFWVPEEGPGHGWSCTGKVRTGCTGIKKASCSSAKKTALVVSTPAGDELAIWNSQESEFATGLEFRGAYRDSIQDLDWTSTPDMQSILAVGFSHRVELLCQQRLTYFDAGPGWATCEIIDFTNFIPYQIKDSIWLSKGSLLVAAGHYLLLYGSPLPVTSNLREESLFEYAARQNGPLDDYHPQMILQCLLWEKVELVKEIIVNLSRAFSGPGNDVLEWRPLPVERFWRADNKASLGSKNRKRYTSLFNGPEQFEDSLEEDRFSRTLVEGLIAKLESYPLPHLTPNEQAHLLTLIQTTLEIEEQTRSLDSNGLRYLISMRSFYILNHRAASSSSPPSKGTIPRATGHRERIRYRDMIWAFYSESQDLLLSASTIACKGKMLWHDARALGIPIWLNSVETLKSQLEVIARNEYMQDDKRDPTTCSLLYFALGKVKLVQGLWKQAGWHREQSATLKLLSQNFNEPRWRTAALKNAFALLSKQRFEYAVAFFLLGNSLKDAVNVCIKQLGDFQLAVALARVVEQSNEGPILQDILRSVVLPTAFREGNRWLGSWAFWLLHRRDLSVRILLTPLQDLATALDIQVTEIGEPHYDDPSLALLFSQLRSKTLQAAKGTSEISGRLEFNFVLQMARVFCRMGCHVLALDLVRSWSFYQPSMAGTSEEVFGSPTVMSPRLGLFDRGRRNSTIMIDMKVTSLPPTRSPSPRWSSKGMVKIEEEPLQEDPDLAARKVGLGNLMKSAKQHVTVPEFDMNSFL